MLVSARQKRRADGGGVLRQRGEFTPRRGLGQLGRLGQLGQDQPIAIVKRLLCLGVIAAVNDEQFLLLVAVLDGGNVLRSRRAGNLADTHPLSKLSNSRIRV